jgi:hypothetical protein
MVTLSNPGTLFAPPQPFSGFQVESTEVNALGTSNPTYDQAHFPTDAQLDANFATLAALAPSQGLVTGQFALNRYAETANINGPNTLQEIGFTQYPFLTSAPSITTTQSTTSTTVGNSISDTANITGLVNPSSGDTVTFNLYNNPNGTGPVLFTDTETVTLGSGGTATATSKGYTATATGTDYWVATFNGDSNNSPVTSGTALEPVTITPATPAINTSQQPASATVGSSIADKATITGLVNASSTDTVTFNLYNNPNGTGTALFTDTETVTLGSGGTATATSKGYTATATGTDYWVATFNGDSNNNSVTSGTALEPVTITPNTPSINTSQQPASATVGSSIADKATVTGLVNASSGDTVTFNLYSSATVQNSSTLLFTDTETVTLSGGTATATSKGYTATATGTDYWVATFNGDSNNTSVNSSATAEPVTITPGTPVAAGEFATIGFWHNKNGQAVINSFNGSSTATQLGNWLATNFPNLFGAPNPYTSAALASFGATSFAGLTNAQVATVYEDLWNPSGVTKNTYVQAFAVALGVYADTPGLGFNATAAGFGFIPVPGGGSSLLFNVGSNGAAFGVPDGTSLTVMTILNDANAAFDATLGTFFNGNSNQQTLTSDLNNVLAGITQQGDIG